MYDRREPSANGRSERNRESGDGMEVTLRAAYIALQIGPFVSLFFALPYTVLYYVRTKSVDVWKCTYFYTFCLYFLCAYFVTWLPLPTPDALAKLKPVSDSRK